MSFNIYKIFFSAVTCIEANESRIELNENQVTLYTVLVTLRLYLIKMFNFPKLK